MFHGHGLRPAVFLVNVNGFAAVIMASLHVAILALSAHEQDVRKRAALFTLAHYYKSRSNRQNASIRRAKRMRVVQQILFWFIRRDIPDGLYENFQSLIQLLIQRAPEHKFRAAAYQDMYLKHSLLIWPHSFPRADKETFLKM